jgi:deoxyhypusine synthase
MAGIEQSSDKRAEILNSKIDPLSPSSIERVDDLLSALTKCAFQGRNLGKALDIFEKMVEKEDCLKVLTLSGAMVPAGMGHIVIEMIEYGLIDVIVTTGANLSHSILNSFAPEEQSHYVGSPNPNDKILNELKINRIYDVYLPEEEYIRAEDCLLPIIKDYLTEQGIFDGTSCKTPLIIRPSDLFEVVGNRIPGKSFVKAAADYKVPIFCGATSDSEFALNLTKYRKMDKLWVVLDEIGDIQRFADIIKLHKFHGTLIVGGGVPRNWAQQIFPYLDQIDFSEKELKKIVADDFQGYDYSVRLHTATELDGGLSGCTLKESISWGKYKPDSKFSSVWADATISLPLLVSGLMQRLRDKGTLKKREMPKKN